MRSQAGRIRQPLCQLIPHREYSLVAAVPNGPRAVQEFVRRRSLTSPRTIEIRSAGVLVKPLARPARFLASDRWYHGLSCPLTWRHRIQKSAVAFKMKRPNWVTSGPDGAQ